MSETPAKLRVTAAAIKHDGTVYTLPPPARHHSLIWLMSALGLKSNIDAQGFVLSDGRFATRAEAEVVAREAAQLLCEPRGVLTSEDLW